MAQNRLTGSAPPALVVTAEMTPCSTHETSIALWVNNVCVGVLQVDAELAQALVDRLEAVGDTGQSNASCAPFRTG